MDGSTPVDPIMILGAARTPLGAFQGGFAGLPATELGAVAIKAALEMTNSDDTLIIVTADHSHTLTISGYARRGNPILGLSSMSIDGKPSKALDGKPYTTLGYMNGPGACTATEDGFDCTRKDLTGVDTTDKDFLQQSLYPMWSETHGGDDVAIFASGPGSELVSGVMEQNEIFHVMGRASGLVSAPTE